MSTPEKNDTQAEAIRRALEKRARGASDASAIAQATLEIWRDVATRLAPVIGLRGVDALFGRSIHLSSARFPWISTAEEQVENPSALAMFGRRLETRDPASATEASLFLLVTFTELLGALIGRPLTDHLLNPVWPTKASVPDQETAS